MENQQEPMEKIKDNLTLSERFRFELKRINKLWKNKNKKKN